MVAEVKMELTIPTSWKNTDRFIDELERLCMKYAEPRKACPNLF